MIVNERVVAYINSLDCGNSDICNTIEKEAIAGIERIILSLLVLWEAVRQHLEDGLPGLTIWNFLILTSI